MEGGGDGEGEGLPRRAVDGRVVSGLSTGTADDDCAVGTCVSEGDDWDLGGVDLRAEKGVSWMAVRAVEASAVGSINGDTTAEEGLSDPGIA